MSRLLSGVAAVLAVLAAFAAHAREEIPTVGFVVERFVVEGDNPLSPVDTGEVLARFTGEHNGPEGILAAADALGAAIQKAGYAFRRVVFPPQVLTDGVIRLEVVGFRLARVEVQGNRHYATDNILGSLPALVVGEVPSTRRLARSLNLANEHPGKHLTVTFRESEEPNSLDARVRVEDERAVRVFSSFNDTGSDETGDTRLAVGFQHANILYRDHQGTFSYTTSPGHLGDVQQWGGSYVLPVYWAAGSLSALFVTSTVNAGELGGGALGPGFSVTGSGDFVGLRYTQHLPRFRALDHRAFLGVDDRRFETAVGAIVSPVRSRPVSLGYAGTYRAGAWTADFEVQYVRNLATGGGNNGTTYAANRAGASAQWDLLRGRVGLVRPLVRRWVLQLRLEGQIANEPLIAGEQFGLGGARSVRGFDEREIAGDNGVFLSAEAWTPPLALDLRALLFADAGYLRSTAPVAVPGLKRTDGILSVGSGFRWSYKNHLSVQFDAGYVLYGTDNVPGTATTPRDGTRDPGSLRAHFNIIARY